MYVFVLKCNIVANNLKTEMIWAPLITLSFDIEDTQKPHIFKK